MTPVDTRPRQIEAAPRDGTIVRLWVRGGSNRPDGVDEGAIWETVGRNNFDLYGHDQWRIVGWNPAHDGPVECEGATPVAFAYMEPADPGNIAYIAAGGLVADLDGAA